MTGNVYNMFHPGLHLASFVELEFTLKAVDGHRNFLLLVVIWRTEVWQSRQCEATIVAVMVKCTSQRDACAQGLTKDFTVVMSQVMG